MSVPCNGTWHVCLNSAQIRCAEGEQCFKFSNCDLICDCPALKCPFKVRKWKCFYFSRIYIYIIYIGKKEKRSTAIGFLLVIHTSNLLWLNQFSASLWMLHRYFFVFGPVGQIPSFLSRGWSSADLNVAFVKLPSLWGGPHLSAWMLTNSPTADCLILPLSVFRPHASRKKKTICYLHVVSEDAGSDETE